MISDSGDQRTPSGARELSAVTVLESIVGDGGIVWTYNDPTESKLATMISSAVSEPFMVL